MRRKILLALLVVFLCSATGTLLAVGYMRSTTTTLRRLIELHQVAELRQHLIIAVQTGQLGLYAAQPGPGKRADVIRDSVEHIEQAVRTCSGCHHPPTIAVRLKRVAKLTSDFERALSSYATASAGPERMGRLKQEATAIGSELLGITEQTSLQASRKLDEATAATLGRVEGTRAILYAATLAALLLVAAVSTRLTSSVTRRIDKLVAATRAVAAGDLGFTLSLDDRTEFGELAAHFNSMSATVKRSYAQLEAQIHERKKAEDSLRVSEERLRFALGATSEIVWDWNLATDVIYHPRWAQIYGYGPEVTPQTGPEAMSFIHDEDRPLFEQQFQQLVEGTRETLEVEHRARTGSGEWKWMLARARVVERGIQGEAIRVVGTCADVTERRRMLDRLYLADRMASVGTLAAGVAHEMNNPLAYVLINVGYALQELGKSQQALGEAGAGAASLRRILGDCRAALEEVEIGASRVRDIVKDLRVFSRVEEEAHSAVDVNRTLEEALRFADPEICHRARVVRKLEHVPPIMANKSRLSQVFVNLLVNAAQAIPEGNVESNEVQVETRVADEGRVVIEVRDTGCGIPPDHRQRIFDPFFTTKPVGMGTGLGLAICHAIVTSLRGEIEVQSELGKGSLFRVSLPKGDPGQETDRKPVPMRPARRGRILVVDDEPLFIRAMVRVLQDEHEVVAVTDPREALRRLQGGERFDLVVSDLVMPQMTGMQLHAEISRLAPKLSAGMLFVTGGGLTEGAADFVAHRRDRVLQKPLSPAAIRGAVVDALDRTSASGEERPSPAFSVGEPSETR